MLVRARWRLFCWRGCEDRRLSVEELLTHNPERGVAQQRARGRRAEVCLKLEIQAGRGFEWLDSGAAGLADRGRRGVRCRSVLTDRPFMFPILSSPLQELPLRRLDQSRGAECPVLHVRRDLPPPRHRPADLARRRAPANRRHRARRLRDSAPAELGRRPRQTRRVAPSQGATSSAGPVNRGDSGGLRACGGNHDPCFDVNQASVHPDGWMDGPR